MASYLYWFYLYTWLHCWRFFMKSCSLLGPKTTGIVEWKLPSLLTTNPDIIWLILVLLRWNVQAFFQWYTPFTRTRECSADTTGRDATPIIRLANFQVVFCRCGPLLTHEICCHQFNFRLIKMKFSDIHPEIYKNNKQTMLVYKRNDDWEKIAYKTANIVIKIHE